MAGTVDQDGIHAQIPYNQVSLSVQKMRDFYAKKPDAPFYQREFGFYSMDRWFQKGLAKDTDLNELFCFDEPAVFSIGGLGWCEAGFEPVFAEKILEDRGDHELVRDSAGRDVLFFKGRRNGFMPEYVNHPVIDWKSWEKNCLWRLNPDTEARQRAIVERTEEAVGAAKRGLHIVQTAVGGYMYLRSLMGPEGVLYMFHDNPDLVHSCMATWLTLADSVVGKFQERVTIDELFIAEDICYNHGSLISPDMMREFLLPYYQQLIHNIKGRQIDRKRHLYFDVDTDGYAVPVIPLYRQLGLDVMSPFEVAAGCDVVKIADDNPELLMLGGVDKRVLAQGKEAIDAMVDRIFPAMRRRGGYIPTCDHGVPEEVSLDNYTHFRRRCLEFG